MALKKGEKLHDCNVCEFCKLGLMSTELKENTDGTEISQQAPQAATVEPATAIPSEG